MRISDWSSDVCSSDLNTLRQGPRGPALMEDFHFREKMFHFDHERIPERVVDARGYGAHGYFELTDSLADVTRADVFQRVGEKTPAFVRFSTVAGSKGSFDLARDVRGFAVKIYTQEGNRSEEHTSELQSLMRISYAVFCLEKKKHKKILISTESTH